MRKGLSPMRSSMRTSEAIALDVVVSLVQAQATADFEEPS